MRGVPTILHLDMDAFFAAVEQASKPSLRGKPVIVGGLGPRGVVATASYEARVFGVHSAMPMAQARRLCPNAAYLTPRGALYRQVSDIVMELLARLSPLVEPLSLDEAFVDLEAGGEVGPGTRAEDVRAVGERLREEIRRATGLSGSVGLAGSKMLAKIASEQAKPDGLVLITPGTERELLAPMPVRTLPGVGPATAEVLRRAGITTVGETAEAGEAELLRLLGRAHGASLYAMANGLDARPVVAERDAKSVSVEDTFDVDLTDRTRVRLEVARLADRCVERLRAAGRSGRTVVIKVRSYDFSTLTRSETLRGPTDDPGVVREAAARLIDGVDTTSGVRLLGVGVSGLADFTQEDLFAQASAAEALSAVDAAAGGEGAAGGAEGAADGAALAADVAPGEPVEEAVDDAAHPAAGSDGTAVGAGSATGTGTGSAAEQPRNGEPASAPAPAPAREPAAEVPVGRRWVAGHDVRHAEYGPGWVQGSGIGRVTVRFEYPGSVPGRVRTFSVGDPDLSPADPPPLAAMARTAADADLPSPSSPDLDPAARAATAGLPGADGAAGADRPPGAASQPPEPEPDPATRPKFRSRAASGGTGGAVVGEGPSPLTGTSSP
ncbi:DNA polymerase IV [Streptomyces sp. NPDC054796]